MEKKHIIQEYDIWVGEDEHELSPELEKIFIDLGFTQLTVTSNKRIRPIENIGIMEVKTYTNEFQSNQYHLVVGIPMVEEDRLLIFSVTAGNYAGNNPIDNGRPYTIAEGVDRLKQLMTKDGE